ncbi:MAG TPA: Maf-like protein [Paludibacteraceae bacterium]|nr:Maf-like protein [Paludibacteraceae bacterium]HOS36814.1 Maf-like protein [Paludibacteraceae bacterium]HPK19705.1 Maf-like protein [Paludibacteraceae bacterium]
MLKNYKVILASQSPRRQELFKGLDIPFSVQTLPEFKESYPQELQGTEIPLYLAQQKANAFRTLLTPDTLIITADTIVWLDGKVYGKPKDTTEAKQMLHALSGKTHDVITGVCVTTQARQESFSATSKVTFATLTDAEIDYYVEKYRPMDKAGSYGVQEWIGYIGVERIEGSYYNVMGLPIQRLYNVLKNW